MPAPTFYTHLDGPVGRLLLVSDGTALTGLFLGPRPVPPDWTPDPAPFAHVQAELADYFAGRLTRFTVPVAPAGTAFQRRAWDALRDIPYGQTISYAEQARRLGHPRASRAVGGANGKNPVSIVVPCHRVVASDGTLGGYGGGLPVKRRLLDLEAGRPA